MKIINQTTGTIIAQKACLADTFLTRMIGLLNRKSLDQGEALIITQCQSIHMFFMRFAIDVVFVDKKNYVVGITEKIKPFRLSPIFWKASYCIELPAGSVQKIKISYGDELKIDKII